MKLVDGNVPQVDTWRPAPVDSATMIAPLVVFCATRSARPSPLKSPVAKSASAVPPAGDTVHDEGDENDEPVDSIACQLPAVSMAATSASPSPLKSLVTTVCAVHDVVSHCVDEVTKRLPPWARPTHQLREASCPTRSCLWSPLKSPAVTPTSELPVSQTPALPYTPVDGAKTPCRRLPLEPVVKFEIVGET